MESARVLQLLLLSLGLIACVSAKDVAHELEQLLGRQNDAQERTWGFVANKFAPEEEKVASFWIDQARQELNARISRPLNKNKAKNIIMFLGDGMPLNTITATRIFKGQQKGNPGEEEMLSFEKFPYTGLSKTYCANAQVPDSACTATAYLCGVKTNIVNIGVTANVDFNNCTASEDPANHVSSIAAWAQAAGKSTGIVTTTSLTHASPAGAYAHTCNRMLECDADKAKYSFGFEGLESCMDLAQQLVTREPGINFEVMLGGGMGKFLPKNKRDSHGNMGEREDNLNLISYWQALHKKGTLITNRKELHKVDVSKVSNIFGLFESYLMDFHAVADAEKQPTLEEMTELAIKKLQQNEEGFFLFVEGGLIDYSNHANKAGISVDETLEFEKAVQKAIDMTSSEDTMIVVTADHAHPVSISGYPGRGNPILGVNANDVDGNGRDYMTLNYAVGPKQYLDEQGKRRTMSDVIDGRQDFDFPSYIPSSQGNHAGDDVGIFASGPYAHLFSGSTQQNLIPHIMAYAACIGDGPKACDV